MGDWGYDVTSDMIPMERRPSCFSWTFFIVTAQQGGWDGLHIQVNFKGSGRHFDKSCFGKERNFYDTEVGWLVTRVKSDRGRWKLDNIEFEFLFRYNFPKPTNRHMIARLLSRGYGIYFNIIKCRKQDIVFNDVVSDELAFMCNFKSCQSSVPFLRIELIWARHSLTSQSPLNIPSPQVRGISTALTWTVWIKLGYFTR